MANASRYASGGLGGWMTVSKKGLGAPVTAGGISDEQLEVGGEDETGT